MEALGNSHHQSTELIIIVCVYQPVERDDVTIVISARIILRVRTSFEVHPLAGLVVTGIQLIQINRSPVSYTHLTLPTKA